MTNPRLANRYAKSLVDLAQETNQFEKVYLDVQYIQAVIKQSRDFAVLLQSPIIKADKKITIINAIIKANITELTIAFITLVVNKGREKDLADILVAFTEQYNQIKNIHVVKLTTAVEISDALKESIQTKVNSTNASGTIQLQTKVKESLIGGFVLEFDNKLVDASILRDLNDVKKQFMNNLFVPELR